MKKKFLSPLTRTERINQLKKAYSDALEGGWWIEDIEPDPKSDEAQKAYPHLWQRLGDNIVQIIGYGGELSKEHEYEYDTPEWWTIFCEEDTFGRVPRYFYDLHLKSFPTAEECQWAVEQVMLAFLEDAPIPTFEDAVANVGYNSI